MHTVHHKEPFFTEQRGGSRNSGNSQEAKEVKELEPERNLFRKCPKKNWKEELERRAGKALFGSSPQSLQLRSE